MSVNLADLSQKISNFIAVQSDRLRKTGDLYYTNTPRNVEVKDLDEEGNIVTNTLPNVAQFRNDVWGAVDNALGQFNKMFYVDATNGDDLNDGSNANKFKTLKKAIDSIPIGGVGFVYITPEEHILTDNISVKNKTLKIRGLSGVATIRSTSKVIGSLNYKNGFVFGGSCSFASYDVNYISDEKADVSLGWNSGAKSVLMSDSSYPCNLSVYIVNSNIVLNSTDAQFAKFGSSSFGGFASLSFSYSTMTLNSNYLIEVTQPIAFYQVANTIDDVNFLLSGVAKDGNGVPRNVISSMIL